MFTAAEVDLGRHPRNISFGCVPVPTKQGKGADYLTIALSHNAYVYLEINIYIYIFVHMYIFCIERDIDIFILYIYTSYMFIRYIRYM